MTHIAVIGTGYVGLSSAVGLAEIGHVVVGADIDTQKISTLQSGSSPLDESGITDALGRLLQAQKLSFSTDVLACVTSANVVFLCLPTPQGDDGSADLSYIENVARSVGPHLLPDAVVVNKSTVPVGTSV